MAGARVPPRLELADLVRTYGDAYRRTHRLATIQLELTFAHVRALGLGTGTYAGLRDTLPSAQS